ncbi:basic amino acid ABC transporter substrate-binding protein [Euzebya sp.]|uniref:basic amino acid ABC transporter substrate-binding protein n=1 Tax=Euzebya sp. TaxID=1971409 RepID=UPI00351919B2
MKITRFTWLVALMAVLALGAAACGSDDGGDAATDDTEAIEDVASEAGDAVDEVADGAEDALGEAEASAEEAADSGDLGLAAEGQMVVGSDIAFEPFESIVDGEPVGFDIDLMDEIASRIGVEVEYQNTPFDTIFTQLASGAFDAIISAITITDERDETIDFSEPYFAANQALATPEGSDITGVADLGSETVLAVQAATTGADYASETFTDAQIQEFPTSIDAFTAMAAGQVDAVFIDLPVVGEQVEQGNAVLAEEVDTGELYGIGVQEGNTALVTAINGALEEIIADGTYAEIYGEWFEGDVPEQFAS